jgi:hypothetical protein
MACIFLNVSQLIDFRQTTSGSAEAGQLGEPLQLSFG